MKYLLFAAMLLPSVLLAQSSPPAVHRPLSLPPGGYQGQVGEALPDNYQLTLTITDKNGQPEEISLVVASTQFSATLGEQSLSFSGSMAVDESGGFTIGYVLGWQTPIVSANGNTQYTSSSMQGTVRLKLGDEVQIVQAGSRVARLSIKKLEPAKAK